MSLRYIVCAGYHLRISGNDPMSPLCELQKSANTNCRVIFDIDMRSNFYFVSNLIIHKKKTVTLEPDAASSALEFDLPNINQLFNDSKSKDV